MSEGVVADIPQAAAAPSKQQQATEEAPPEEEAPPVKDATGILPSPPATSKSVRISARTEEEKKAARAKKALEETMAAMQDPSTGTKPKAKRRAPMTPKSGRSARSLTSSRSATQELRDALREAAEAEEREVRELRYLLSKTTHTPAPGRFKRVGDVATNSLRRLDDGQNDDIAILRKRREEEEYEIAGFTGKPKWDSSVWMYVPPALKGCDPVTPEPWARDSKVYKDSLQTAHGAGPPRHAHMIENAMAQYRKELGALASPPVSARLAKVYAAQGVATPPASPLGRPQTPKLAKEPSSHFNAAKAAAVNDAAAARKARIAAKGGPKS